MQHSMDRSPSVIGGNPIDPMMNFQLMGVIIGYYFYWFLVLLFLLCTGSVVQWLRRTTVKRFSSRRVGSNPSVSHSKALNEATHNTLFQSTQLLMSTRSRALGELQIVAMQ